MCATASDIACASAGAGGIHSTDNKDKVGPKQNPTVRALGWVDPFSV